MQKKITILGVVIILILIIIISGIILILKPEKNQVIENNDWLNQFPVYQTCSYQEEIVYYVPSPCCDQYNYLYNQAGEKICAPDGGYSGQGDGRCPDFNFDTAKCKLISAVGDGGGN